MLLNKYLLTFAIAATATAVAALSVMQSLRTQRNQLTTAIQVARDSTKHYTNALGEEVSKHQVVELDNHNMKALAAEYKDITQHFDGINKRLNNVESLQKLSFEVTKRFEMKPRDTTIINDYGVKLQAWSFNNKDKWFSIDGMVILDSAYRKVIATPHITANIYGAEVYKKPRKKILGLRIGRKTRTFEVASDNPYIKFGEIKFTRRYE